MFLARRLQLRKPHASAVADDQIGLALPAFVVDDGRAGRTQGSND
jgi:hypothetical protein